MKEKKRHYEEPSVRVVELRTRPQLLAGSLQGYRNSPYGSPTDW